MNDWMLVYDGYLPEQQGLRESLCALGNGYFVLPLMLRINDGDWWHPDQQEILDYQQSLDLQRGVLTRRFRYRDDKGRVTRWQEQRLVSMANAHLAALQVEVSAENWDGTLSIRSAIDGSVTNSGVQRYSQLKGRHLETLDTEQPGENLNITLAVDQAPDARMKLNTMPNGTATISRE